MGQVQGCGEVGGKGELERTMGHPFLGKLRHAITAVPRCMPFALGCMPWGKPHAPASTVPTACPTAP